MERKCRSGGALHVGRGETTRLMDLRRSRRDLGGGVGDAARAAWPLSQDLHVCFDRRPDAMMRRHDTAVWAQTRGAENKENRRRVNSLHLRN